MRAGQRTIAGLSIASKFEVSVTVSEINSTLPRTVESGASYAQDHIASHLLVHSVYTGLKYHCERCRITGAK